MEDLARDQGQMHARVEMRVLLSAGTQRMKQKR
jgi:hypothetical protein